MVKILTKWFAKMQVLLEQSIKDCCLQVVVPTDSEGQTTILGGNYQSILSPQEELANDKETIDKLKKEFFKLGQAFAFNGFQSVVNLTTGAKPKLNKKSKDVRFGVVRKQPDIQIVWNLINADIMAWAEAHAADLIKTSLFSVTQERIRELVIEAISSGISTQTLSDNLMQAGILSEARAEMIARTETAIAAIQGNQISMSEIQDAFEIVLYKEWLVSELACDECLVYEDVSVRINEEFPEGDPPLHPNCRCDLTYWTEEELQNRTDNPDSPFVSLASEEPTF